MAFVSPAHTAFYYGVPLSWEMLARVFTHMLSHGSWGHLLGNFIYGFPFLAYAEIKTKNWKKFLGLYILFGLVALASQCLFYWAMGVEQSGMIGSSGAIFGVIGYALASLDESKVYKWCARAVALFHIVTQGMAVLYLLSGGFAFVAYSAHLGGLVCGISVACLPSIRSGVKWLISLLQNFRR